MKEIPCKPIDAIDDAGLLSEIRDCEEMFRSRSIFIDFVNFAFFLVVFVMPGSLAFIVGLPLMREGFDSQLRPFLTRLGAGGLSGPIADFIGSTVVGSTEIAFFCIVILFAYGLGSLLWMSAKTLCLKHPIVAQRLVIADNAGEVRAVIYDSPPSIVAAQLRTSWNSAFGRRAAADFDAEFFKKNQDGAVISISPSLKIPFTSESNKDTLHGDGNEIKVEFKQADPDAALFVFKAAAGSGARGLPIAIAVFDNSHMQEIKGKVASLCKDSIRCPQAAI